MQIHHIRHWADGSETTLDNLVTLCCFHRRRVHEGLWSSLAPRRDRIHATGWAGDPSGGRAVRGCFRRNTPELKARNAARGLAVDALVSGCGIYDARWRITFRFLGGNADEVRIEDYHKG